jgi:predicted Zn-dependent protease
LESLADPDRRPTAQEIEELIDLVRRDPSSPAFIDLGEAYLALGRPKDAVSVGNMGLQGSPDNNEGRVMLARAHCALHQWKEAQGELLRVVKVDRSSRNGFALLGEVLLRRQDYERAVPVLQHAQNLDPTSPTILMLLKRARSGQPLDAPPPLPQPVPPRGETNYGLQIDDAPPKAPPPPKPSRVQPVAMPAAHVAQTMAIPPAPSFDPSPADDPWNSPPPPAPPTRGIKQTAPPPMSVEGVRPRVVSAAKPQNAAAASLRQSAAVGENYLNDLLTGGLLDVAGVRVPDSDFDLRPDRRWGRSTRRAFIFLFVVLVLGIGGGGTWYWWTEKQKSEAVARLEKDARDAMKYGDFAGLEVAIKKLAESLEKDPSPYTLARVGEVTALEALLYGTETDRVDAALKRAAHDIKPGDEGSRELVIGRAAVELSRLGSLDAPGTVLADVQKQLDEYLAKHDTDKWARWLKGRTLLAAGERKSAKATLKQASDGEDGLVVAMIDQADLMVDDGDIDGALKLYDAALAKSKDHPLAVLGEALARAETSASVDKAIDELTVKLDKNYGSRVLSYRELAFAFADSAIEDYAKSGEALKKSTANHPPLEPRFFARVAWLHFKRGELEGAATSRSRVAWYGKGKAEDDPTVMLVDAALSLASGCPDKALDAASKLDGIRPRMLRAYADLDLGKAKDALAELDEVLKKAPDNLEAQILREQAHMIGSEGKERAAAADALEKLARKAKSKIGRHALGVALLATGNAKDAQTQFEQAVADLTDDAPNPLAYRTYTALAEIALANDDITGAGKRLDQALALNQGFFPTRTLQAKVVLKANDPDRALQFLDPILKEKCAVTPQVQLLLAEALATHKGVTAKEKDLAVEQLTQIKDKIQPPSEVGRVAALIDAKLPEKLGVPVPPPEGGPKAPPPRVVPKKHR